MGNENDYKKMKTLGDDKRMEDYLYPETIDALLAKWDKGEAIFTIELGGLGPGYEQAIQLAAVEFAREAKSLKGIKCDDEKSTKRFMESCDKTLKRIDDKLLGLSGAQYGAATWLAFNWCFNGGPRKLIERCKQKGQEDRIIQVSKSFPSI